MKTKWLFLIGILLWAMILSQLDLIRYGLQQAQGQFRVLWEAKPLHEIQTSVPDSVRYRLAFIQEVKKFAEDSLGLRPTKTYQSYFDQQGKPLIWVITACPPYSLQPYTWHVPFLGEFSYKGFFDRGEADRYRRLLELKGFETRTGEVSAWSTLGYLADPILSSMLWRDDISLASLIIHELTHSTLFVPNQLSFNENLADFIGDHGAKWFITLKYGPDSPILLEYERSFEQQKQVREHIQRGAKQLDSLYATFPTKERNSIQDYKKQQLVQKIITTLDTVGVPPPSKLPNNAFFAAYLTYQGQQNELEEEFRKKFNGNFKAYLAHLTQKYAR